jgi:hypothetical protein
LKHFTLIIYLVFSLKTIAQNPDSLSVTSLKISGYIDVFYAFDFNAQRFSHQRLPFLYNHNRHNEVNLNLGFIKAAFENKHYRVNLAFHAGTYVNDNYANEPGVLKNIFEANVGLALNKKKNLWIDAGIFPSHIGFESAISIDNWTLTRSVLAENSPYYLSGARLNFLPTENLEINFLVINGWQHIERPQLNNSLPSFGSQINYTISEMIIINWSTFAGSEYPDKGRRMRYFNNFYSLLNLTDKIGLITGFDIGFEQKDYGSNNYSFWYSPVIISRFKTSDKTVIAARAEYYQDKNHVIIQPLSSNGFSVMGYSLNVDYLPVENIVLRVEGRWFNSENAIFNVAESNKRLNNNYFIVTSIAAKF